MAQAHTRAWTGAAVTRVWAADVQVRSGELCAKAGRRCLACGMPGANRLTVAIAAHLLAQRQRFP